MQRTVRRRAANSVTLILRSARAEEMPQSTNARARVSKDEGEGVCDIFAQLKPRRGAGGRTNLRLWETIAGSPCLFPACYLQGPLQLQRVER